MRAACPQHLFSRGGEPVRQLPLTTTTRLALLLTASLCAKELNLDDDVNPHQQSINQTDTFALSIWVMGRRGCRTGWLAAAARGLLVLVVVVVQHCAHRTDGLAAGDCASTYSGRRDFLKRAVTAASVAVATAGHVQSSPAVDSAGATALPAGAPQSTAVSEAFSGLVSGAAVSTAKIILLHPVDTVKVRLQTSTPSSRTGGKLFQGLFDGILPPLVTGAPSGALFFAAKDSLQSSLISILGPGNREIATLLAVGLAQFPYCELI